MALMGLNHLLDDAPHHLLFSKREKERARLLEAQSRKYHQTLGFVTEIPDTHDAYAGYQDSCPPPVPQSGKEAYPFARSFYEGNGKGGKVRREREVSDAWVKMRGTRVKGEGRRGEGNGKRVRFEREVRWWVFDGGEEESQ